jgi:hypothetical protein
MLEGVVDLFKNPYFVALGAPVALLVVGAVGKGVIRGKHTVRNLYMGFDATLTGLYAGVVYLYDLARSSQLESKLKLTAGFLAVGIVLLVVVLGCHQAWEKEERNSPWWMQFLMLGLFANFLGFGLLFVFVYLVKGAS